MSIKTLPEALIYFSQYIMERIVAMIINVNIKVLVFLSITRVANILCSTANIKPGDRVLVLVRRIPEYWLMQLACLRTGERP